MSRIAAVFAICLLAAASARGDDKPAKFTDIDEFIPDAAEIGQRGLVPDRGDLLTFKILEILSETEMIIDSDRRVIYLPAGRVEAVRRSFIISGQSTKGLVTDRPLDLAGKGYRAVGTRKVGSKTLVVVEPDATITKKAPAPRPRREDRVKEIVADLPTLQRKAIAATEARIEEVRKLLKEPIYANGPSGPGFRKELAALRTHLEKLKTNAREAAPTLSTQSPEDAWGRLPAETFRVLSINDDSMVVECDVPGGFKAAFLILGKPPADAKKGEKTKVTGFFIVEENGRAGGPRTPTLSRLVLPKEK